MTLRLTALPLCLLVPLIAIGCGDDGPMLSDTGVTDTGTDTSRDTGAPPDTGTDGCVPNALCMPMEECQEGRTMCDPERCEASGPAPADTECTGGTCDGLGACIRTEDAMWTASDEDMFDAFGGDVAIDGNYAVIGVGSAAAGVYADAAYVWERDSGGNWAEQAILSTDDVTGGQFGVAVDIDGSTIVVGVPDASHAAMDAGTVYVFRRAMDGSWPEFQRIRPSDPTRGQRFGRSVAIDGDRIVVGAFTNGMVTPGDAGKVYVFEAAASGGMYSEATVTPPSGLNEGDGLGWSVDIEGDRVVAGAPMGDSARGSVYVFTRGGGGTWTMAERLEASEGAAGDELGAEVVLRGTTLIASAPLAEEMSVESAGAVYVFTESGGSFTQSGRLVASDGATEDFFGSIALDGDTLLVGSPGYDRVTRRDMGIVYDFTRSGGAFTESEQIYRSMPEVGDRFGAAVAVSGARVLVGAPGADLMTNEDAGAVFFFDPLPRP